MSIPYSKPSPPALQPCPHETPREPPYRERHGRPKHPRSVVQSLPQRKARSRHLAAMTLTTPPEAGHRASWRRLYMGSDGYWVWGGGRKEIVRGPAMGGHLLRGRARRRGSTGIRGAGARWKRRRRRANGGWRSYGGYGRGYGATTTRRRCSPGGTDAPTWLSSHLPPPTPLASSRPTVHHVAREPGSRKEVQVG